MLAKVLSAALMGIDAYVVEVEVDISPGLPAYTTVGLPEASVKESKERVKTAIQNSGYGFSDDRITVNLAPAHTKKEGTGFDLPIALGILSAMRLIPQSMLEGYMITGELSLDGRVKPVNGTLSMALQARRAGCRGILVPEENSREAAVVQDIPVLAVKDLHQTVEFFRGLAPIEPVAARTGDFEDRAIRSDLDFAEVMGQEHVKRAIEVAAAGGHNLLMLGPPGSGKTMLAKRIPTILPPMTFDEALETTKIYSVVGLLDKDQAMISRRPFRSPHHTISDAGLIGGGHIPRPGEVSLSHNGVLFLDELPEFKKHVLEVLRQPLEDLKVTISRATMTLTYPASLMLVAAMNPCPCGYLTDTVHSCSCNTAQVQRYRSRISGPLLDRIDIHVEVPAVPYKDLSSRHRAESSAAIRDRITRSRNRQQARFKGTQYRCNAQMGSRLIRRHCAVDATGGQLLETAVDRLGLSARAYNRILKIARTIADLEEATDILPHHISESIQYRSLDRTRPRPA